MDQSLLLQHKTGTKFLQLEDITDLLDANKLLVTAHAVANSGTFNNRQVYM